MDESQRLIFRHDNAPHHKQISTFPHHEHTQDGLVASNEPTIREILLKIAQRERDAELTLGLITHHVLRCCQLLYLAVLPVPVDVGGKLGQVEVKVTAVLGQ